ncbi:leukocyte surface antigen CD53 isoform X1 [Harpegnathos saltator]|uniref:leukocyte surface antigen CD53 isoform X1 n=1 Tax=Harpegnathos saltator TaxID=610380 RepID=UPI00058E1BE2|nr:leukocyte surface antigen CD53 isoform X1 [Harpegnathos saltator]
MGRAFVCFRYFLMFGAVVLGLSGAITSIFSGYFIYQLHEYAPLTPDNVCGSSATLLTMGVITCGVGWFAFQFLNFSNRGQVITFAVTLTIITVTELGVGIWALVRHEQVDVLPSARLEENFALATTDQKSSWDHMQSKLHCCGIDGPADYRGHNSIPWSCCNTTNSANDNSTEGACTNIYKRGCQHVVINRTRSILLYVFLLALCSVLLQVSFILCIFCYAKIYRKKMEKRVQLEIGKRASEPDTKDNLLARRSKHLNNVDDS